MKNQLLILIGLLFIKCSSTELNESHIRLDFDREFPTYSFVSSSITANEGDTLRAAIKFRKPINDQTWIDNWTYVMRDGKWGLVKTGKNRIINALEPIDRTTELNAMLQINPRHIKIDSIIYSKDTFMIKLPGELVLRGLYHGKTIEEPTYIPEGDSVTLVYQRHLGNLKARNHRPK